VQPSDPPLRDCRALYAQRSKGGRVLAWRSPGDRFRGDGLQRLSRGGMASGDGLSSGAVGPGPAATGAGRATNKRSSRALPQEAEEGGGEGGKEGQERGARKRP